MSVKNRRVVTAIASLALATGAALLPAAPAMAGEIDGTVSIEFKPFQETDGPIAAPNFGQDDKPSYIEVRFTGIRSDVVSRADPNLPSCYFTVYRGDDPGPKVITVPINRHGHGEGTYRVTGKTHHRVQAVCYDGEDYRTFPAKHIAFHSG